MRIVFVKPVKGTRAENRLHKDSDSCYPKGTRSVAVSVEVNGTPAEVMVTDSGKWANAATFGCNGWIRYEGKVYWWLFDAGFDARKIAGMKFVVDSGNAPPPAKREPADPVKEAARVAACKATFAAKNAPVIEAEPVTVPEGETAEA